VVAERSAARLRAKAAHRVAGSLLQHPAARCEPRTTHPRWAAASWGRRNLPSAALRILMIVYRIPAWPGNAAAADNHPDTASNGCTTCPEARCRWRRRYRELRTRYVLV